MKETYIRRLIRLVEESQIDSLEVSRWGQKVKISRRSNLPSNGHSDQPAAIHQVTPTPSLPPAAPPSSETVAPSAAVSADGSSRLVAVKAPMVGTLYMAPAPDADPYVSLNQRVTVGQVLCIVEAMKLMNEIESEVSGRVAEICVQNAQPVEFGQELFLIDPD